MPIKRTNEPDPNFDEMDSEQDLDDDDDDDLFAPMPQKVQAEPRQKAIPQIKPQRVDRPAIASSSSNRPRQAPAPVEIEPAEPTKARYKYAAFHSPEARGLIDQETQEVLATSQWEALALIYNKLEEIQDTIGRM